jgi:uncharacterized protein (DUF2384 family)
MTIPQQRMSAFLSAGVILWDIVKAGEHLKKWGAELPEPLVREAKAALRYYPSSLEILRAADEQRSMHTWMARATRDMELQDDVHGRLKEAAAQIGVETAPDKPGFDSDAYLDAWLFTEHPALGYREPIDLIDVASNPEMFVQLFKAEVTASREARRVFESEKLAYQWLREVNRSLGGIPLEMLGSDTGRRKVMDELRRLAARYLGEMTQSAQSARDTSRPAGVLDAARREHDPARERCTFAGINAASRSWTSSIGLAAIEQRASRASCIAEERIAKLASSIDRTRESRSTSSVKGLRSQMICRRSAHNSTTRCGSAFILVTREVHTERRHGIPASHRERSVLRRLRP